MRVMGIDPSLTSTGICDVDGEVGLWKPPKDLKGASRLAWFENHLRVVLAPPMTRPNLFVIEGYAYGRPNQAHQIGELGGVIRLTIWRAHTFCVEVPPSSLKKYATGKGNASKDEVLAAAVHRSGREMTNDQADAWWLRQIGLCFYMPEHADRVPVSMKGLEVLSSFKNWPGERDIDRGPHLVEAGFGASGSAGNVQGAA